MSKLRGIALVLGGTAVVVLTAPLVAWGDGEAVGVTFCYPIVGPVQRFSPSLSDSLLRRVRAHERAHADQCRRDGSSWYFIRRLVPRQRLRSEAGAYCAEIRDGIAIGGRVRLVYAGALDELRETAWFHRIGTVELAGVLAAQCPGIAAQAERDERDWQAWVRGRRGTDSTSLPPEGGAGTIVQP